MAAAAGKQDLGLARVAFISVAPTIAICLGSEKKLIIFAGLSSFVATVLDSARSRRRLMPFPIFLLLVYALQAACCVFALQLSILNVLDWSSSPRGSSAADGDVAVLPGAAAGGNGTREIKTMSIVMAAHNEHQYMKRTLESIYATTPDSILKEIIIIDDGSDPPISESTKDFPQVKIIRHETRRGLIKSKHEGGNMATSDSIMFLDAHIKPEPNWALALLRHMNINYKRVVVPLIPILDGKTWVTNNNAVGVKMMFDWTLFFQWFEDYNDLVPCMSGGLFAITRDWWHESGQYDYGMKLWGAENIEQSIRIWLCGGEIYVARDSRIAHVFRPTFPYSINSTEIYINKVRTVETWFDEYKETYYAADPAARRFVPYMGDISERQALQKRLQCKPFKWYVQKFRAVFKDKHMIPSEVFNLRDKTQGLCLSVHPNGRNLLEAPCNKDDARQQWSGGNDHEELRNFATNNCFDANAGLQEKEGMDAFLYRCFPKNAQQAFLFTRGNIRWRDYCVQGAPEENILKIKTCGSDFLDSQGNFEKFEARQTTA